jgi:hypothetical protein
MSGRMTAAAAAALVLAGLAAPVEAIPSFARKYRVSCSMCHAPVPRLNAFGEQFAANGFEMVVGEAARDTLSTGDPLLRLMAEIPLAVRLDAYLQGLVDAPASAVATDLQTPWAIKLLSGGQIADKVSYYLYFFMSERGEVAGLEDAYVQFTDLAGSGVSLLVGQFQVSDPLFKRELRLEYEDYQPYRVRVGDAAADLTYDRGFMAVYSPWADADIALQLLNGQGLRESTAARQYDRDDGKAVSGRFSQGFGPVRVGYFGYLSSERADGVGDDIRVHGPDLTLDLGGLAELNAQFLRRTDSDPFFGGGPTDTEVDALFGELIWGPQGPNGRWFLTGLYNRITADSPVFGIRQGESGLLDRYESAALGVNYVFRRNLRFTGEAQWDVEREYARLTAGFVAAF